MTERRCFLLSMWHATNIQLLHVLPPDSLRGWKALYPRDAGPHPGLVLPVLRAEELQKRELLNVDPLIEELKADHGVDDQADGVAQDYLQEITQMVCQAPGVRYRLY